MSDASVFPCARCGASLRIALGGQTVTCASCGHSQALPEHLDRELRAHLAAVDAAMEDADRDRAIAAGEIDNEGRELPPRAAVTGLGWLASLTVFACFYCLMTGFFRGFWWSLGCFVVGYFVLVIYAEIRRGRSQGTRVVPQAGVVSCGSCGAFVPIQATDHALPCPYCSAEVIVSHEDRKRAREAFEREAAFARAQALAASGDDQPRD